MAKDTGKHKCIYTETQTHTGVNIQRNTSIENIHKYAEVQKCTQTTPVQTHNSYTPMSVHTQICTSVHAQKCKCACVLVQKFAISI